MKNVVISHKMSEYWQRQGATLDQRTHGRVFELSTGEYVCSECCNKDRCDDITHHYISECPHCLGTRQNLTSEVVNEEMKKHKSQLQSFRKKLSSITVDEFLKDTGIVIKLFDEHFK